ncbi:MAG: fibronectin type III domain-containing protein [Algicola sp.]|nr:fibronectin type III domain-containing protein [Algicola sp.]
MKKLLSLVSIICLVYSCSSNDETNNDDPTCGAPSNIASSAITTNSATINWSSSETSASYIIEYGETGFGLGNGTSVSSNNTNTTLNGLTSNTAYQVYVRTDCDENGLSSFTGPFNFTTIEQTCASPTDLQAFNITDTSASLIWLSDESSVTFDVEYGVSGFSIGNGTVTTTSNSFIEITGLTPSTPYEFYVRTNCSNANSSDYTGPIILNTVAACTAPFGVDFANLTGCSFDVAWNSNNETAWEVEYGEVGFSLGTGTVIPTSNTMVVLTENIVPSTTYEVYVRSNCGSQGFSAYTDALVVTTNPIDETFFVGDYLIQDVDATVGPGNGTENFASGIVTLSVDPTDPSKRIFFSNVLPIFNNELEEITIQINTDGSISLGVVDPSISCGTGNYILTDAGANNTVITNACLEDNFIVINYLEDPANSCGGPFNSSFSLTKQ